MEKAAPSKKQKYSLLALTLWVIAWIIGEVLHLNVESWATAHGYDRLYQLLPNSWVEAMKPIVDWLLAALSYAAGQFGLGFALGAVIFAFWDPMAKLVQRGGARNQKISAARRWIKLSDEIFAELSRKEPNDAMMSSPAVTREARLAAT